MRNTAESKEHEKLVRMMASHFTNEGHSDVRADLPGYTQPDTITKGKLEHRPDVTCVKRVNGKERLVILEAETCTSIADSHTASQWELFRLAADYWRGEFHVVVPRVCGYSDGAAKAQQRLQELGIAADEIWIPSS